MKKGDAKARKFTPRFVKAAIAKHDKDIRQFKTLISEQIDNLQALEALLTESEETTSEPQPKSLRHS